MKNYLYALFTVAVWSTTATISKIILTDIPNFEALTVTSSFAVLCLLIINIKSGIINKMREYSLRDYLKMIGLGFIGMFVYTATYNYGITQLTSQEACIINYLWPIMIVLFSSVILKEKMTAVKIISLLCSFVGIIILSSGSGEAATGNALMGIISCVIAAACYGLFSVLNKKANYDQNITMMICWLVVTVCSVAIGPFTENWKMFSSMQLAGFAWIGIVVNGVGYLLWAIALRNESNTAKIANLAYLIPLFSLIISAVVLDEKLTYNALIGFVLVMGGILLQNLRGSKIKNNLYKGNIMEFKITGKDIGSNIFIDNEREKDGVLFFDVNMILENAAPQEFEITFRIPDIDIYSVWSPSLRFDRRIGPIWGKRKSESSLASWMPVHSLVSVTGQNRMTVALSDAENPMTIASGECEDDATIVWCITFHTKNVDPNKPYKATVRIDTRDIPFYESIYDVTAWWENECGYKPAHIPEHAKLPMNSLWYSYHYDLDAEDIIKEAALSKELGMETVIVDDGWQTDDNNRSYKYCGDWQVAFSKFPDMKKFVDRVHDTGMKIMLWFSVPFIGIAAKNFERFKSYLLSEVSDDIEFYAFDPRYKEVRDYLLGMYVKAVKEWGFDGLKLDFIDEFVLNSKKALEFDPRRDYQSLEEAIDRLMTDVTDALRAINPEVLIEFRQTYVGPAIRKYGNMLRVGDCANDALFNRAEIPSLKLTSGNHAVHSDMLMWNYEDKVESAALEFVSILYAVPQISMKIAKLRDDHKQMLKFYLSFWRENRDILIEGKFGFANHESVTSIAWAEKNGKAIITTYTDSSVCVSKYPSAIVVNASRHPSIIIKGADGKKYKVNDCMGNILEEGTVCGALCEINVPLSGMICID